MGHYPIRCVHCMKSALNNEVLFRYSDKAMTLEGRIADPSFMGHKEKKFGSLDAGREEKFPGDIGAEAEATSGWGKRVAGGDTKLNSGSAVRGHGQDIDYLSLEEMSHYFRNVAPIYSKIEVTPDFVDDPYEEPEEMLLTGVRFEDNTGSYIVNKRYCPHCGRQLLPQAGAMPLYLITLIGATASGKTVYLTVLNSMLRGGGGKMVLGEIRTSSGGAVHDEFNSFGEALLGRGELPDTTRVSLKDPLVSIITYRPTRDGDEKQCMVGFFDMKGEDYGTQAGVSTITGMETRFSNSDGFLLMAEPMSMEGIYNRIPMERSGSQEQMFYPHLRNMAEQLNSHVLPFFPGQKISAPTVVMLTKSDILERYHKQLGIPLSHPSVAPRLSSSTDTYYSTLSTATEEVLRSFAPDFYGFIKNSFSQTFSVTASALGGRVKLLDGNRVDEPQLIYPRRVLDPLLYLLMELEFLPPFSSGAFAKDPIGTTNAWGATHINNWTDLK